jgi:hypothetical protein
MGGPHDGNRHHEAYEGIGSYKAQRAHLTQMEYDTSGPNGLKIVGNKIHT